MATVNHETIAEHAGHEPQGFWRRAIFSTDHKTIGKQYLFTALFMAGIGGLLAMLIRAQLGWPGREWGFLEALMPNAFPDGVMKPDFYYALVTMHGTIMVFFFLTAILTGGFGNFLIPLQIGARDMAFPFLNMLSYWLFVPACLVLIAAFFVEGGAPISGWTAYPPLSALPQSGPGQGLGQDLWLIAVALLILSIFAGGINYLTTVINHRARGMSFGRMPLTVWGLFIASLIGLLSFPVLLAGAVLLLFDRLGGTSFYLPTGLVVGGQLLDTQGGNPLLWQHLFWFLGHPEVYILILPPMGIASEVIAANARKPIFGYKFMVGSMATIGFLGFLVWGHHMFTSGMNPLLGMTFMLTTIVIAVPSAIKTFNWLATLWGAKLRFTTAMLFALGFVSVFVTGGLTGMLLAQPGIDVYFHDTYFVVAHFHLVMGVASLFGVFAGIYHWFPKLFGRMMNERLGRIHFFLTFVGAYATFFPMHFAGISGMMRRIFSPQMYTYLQGLQGINEFISYAAFGMGIAQVVFVVNFFYSLFRGRKAEENPWQANTLEWSAPSPPPHGNWGDREPVAYRWPYEYSAPGAEKDYVPQWEPVAALSPAAASKDVE